ncbi:MAG: hypothetical protein WD674_01415 [Cucumibacter sp.]
MEMLDFPTCRLQFPTKRLDEKSPRAHRWCEELATMDYDEPSERFWQLIEEAKQIQEGLTPLLPKVAEARRRYMRSRSEADRIEMERVEGEARELVARHGALDEEIRAASGLPDEALAELDKPNIPG